MVAEKETATGIVFESPVQSGFMVSGWWTEIRTGPSISQDLKKQDWDCKKLQKTAKNRTRPVFWV